MSDIKLKIRQIVYRIKHDFLSIENLILVGAIILCIIWTFSSITAMTRNWKLSERLASEKKSLELLTVEIETLELENDYYETQEYQELAARRYANKQLDGEHMVYLPANSEAAKNKHRTATTTTEIKEYSNPEKWLKFFFPENQ